MVLKANDRRTSCPCHDEFRGPRSDYVRQGPRMCPVSLHFKDSVSINTVLTSVPSVWRDFSDTRVELMTHRTSIRYIDLSASIPCCLRENFEPRQIERASGFLHGGSLTAPGSNS
ncbi:hypothetical protein TNCV_2148921 [Trichonephila clavipes]|nr:hypothetical protein TNCV_2148921 [Trichonephila clavipes]